MMKFDNIHNKYVTLHHPTKRILWLHLSILDGMVASDTFGGGIFLARKQPNRSSQDSACLSPSLLLQWPEDNTQGGPIVILTLGS